MLSLVPACTSGELQLLYLLTGTTNAGQRDQCRSWNIYEHFLIHCSRPGMCRIYNSCFTRYGKPTVGAPINYCLSRPFAPSYKHFMNVKSIRYLPLGNKESGGVHYVHFSITTHMALRCHYCNTDMIPVWYPTGTHAVTSTTGQAY